jgi:putative flippase GtrA
MNTSFVSLIRQGFAAHRTLILYFFIGVSASLIDVVGFFAFHTLLGIISTLATTYSVVLATIYAFILNAHFNFKQTDRFLFRFLSYSFVSGVGLGISALMLWFFNMRMGFDGNLIKILSLPIVFVVQYLLNKKVTFQSKQSNNQ